MTPRFRTLAALALLLLPVAPAARADWGFQDAAVSSWVINDSGVMGQSPDPTINATVSLILADVQRVRYTTTDVYVEATGIPSYPVGPFAMNPNTPSNQQWLFRIPRVPTSAAPGPFTATGLGAIGTWVNGVVAFNPRDAMSYNNGNVWHQNAVVVEGPSFDAALGHPAPDRRHPVPSGVYHHHQRPVALLAQLGEDGVAHSPLIGFGFDGYPIYGPQAFAGTDGSGGVVRMRSSYQLRNITVRQTLPDGTVLAPASYGPPVSGTYPFGYYIEDFEYVAGLGDLDEHGGRFAVTSEYPGGTYAYHSTVDGAGASAYPYTIGPTYYGVFIPGNAQQTVTVPANACTYSTSCIEGSCPGGCTDLIDDDLDGSLDCADSDCAGDPACISADADGDGVVDALDCAPADITAHGLPLGCSGLMVAKDAVTASAELAWDDTRLAFGTGTTYEVASDLLSTLHATGIVAAPCVASGLPAAAFSDGSLLSDDGFYYLVRPVNACGPARADGWGFGSTGDPSQACP